ncbi:MAG: 1-acyl-sn-glycerol-3-phosphate acyltransferase [Prevotellaceae bacterium]|jgi:1-acyl-sn-glycerol-3-phosphate acyltransferase|nr:1-acyl-sn-glycerol-3-phosphate acyltransferase [Prevotellaceae bacterium]
MKKLAKFIYIVAAWTYAAITAPVLMIVALLIFVIAYPFDLRRKALHVFSGFWGLQYFWMNPLWRIRYTGKENVDKRKSYIMVCNHQSYLDICAMYKIPLVFKWISKVEATKIPFIGWLLPMHGDVLIKRGEGKSSREMMTKCAHWIKLGASISIFPEGTRTPDGRIHNFKEGAFLLARVNNLPILPVVMDGTYDMFSKKGLAIGGCATLQIRVLSEISAKTVASMGIKELSTYLHDMMLNEHKKMAPQRYRE